MRAAWPGDGHSIAIDPAALADDILTDWTSATTLQEWQMHWQATAAGHRSTTASRDPAWNGKQVRKRHVGLTKAESSLLTQARTGHIGLNQYLAWRGVPGYTSTCTCGTANETFQHIALECVRGHDRPVRRPRTEDALETALRGHGARPLLRWVIRSGRLGEYRLAAQLDLD